MPNVSVRHVCVLFFTQCGEAELSLQWLQDSVVDIWWSKWPLVAGPLQGLQPKSATMQKCKITSLFRRTWEQCSGAPPTRRRRQSEWSNSEFINFKSGSISPLLFPPLSKGNSQLWSKRFLPPGISVVILGSCRNWSFVYAISFPVLNPIGPPCTLILFVNKEWMHMLFWSITCSDVLELCSEIQQPIYLENEFLPNAQNGRHS